MSKQGTGKSNHEKIADFLKENGFPAGAINSYNHNGDSPLTLAAKKAVLEGTSAQAAQEVFLLLLNTPQIKVNLHP